MRPGSNSTILDVVDTPDGWHQNDYLGEVLLGNLKDLTYCSDISSNFEYIRLDGRKIPFKNKVFEIVFSNSTIEHIRTGQEQKDFAHEIMRVG